MKDDVPSLGAAVKPVSFHMGLLARLRAYLFAGILLTAPIAITIYIVWLVVTFVDQTVTRLLPPAYNPNHYLPFDVPGLGLVVVGVTLIIIGWLAAGMLGRLLRTGQRRRAEPHAGRALGLRRGEADLRDDPRPAGECLPQGRAGPVSEQGAVAHRLRHRQDTRQRAGRGARRRRQRVHPELAQRDRRLPRADPAQGHRRVRPDARRRA